MNKKNILKKAQAWGFKCEFDSDGKPLIMPQNAEERWKLRIADEGKWILIVGDVPQVLCSPSEVMTFLARHQAKLPNALPISQQNQFYTH